jgi:hypothetical protein
MKIVNRKTFLQLPEGTLFKKASEPWAFDDLCVKGVSLGDAPDYIDFFYMPLGEVQTEDTFSLAMTLMAEAGDTYPLDLDTSSRDGMFDKEAMFLVFEKADVEALRDFLIALAGQP